MFAALKKNRIRPGLTGICLDVGGVALASVDFGPERRSRDAQEAGTKRKPVLESCHYRAYAGAASPAEVLQQLSAEYDLAHARCTTLLAGDQYKLLLTETPEVNDDELASTLRWSIKDLVDTPVEELTIETFKAPDTANSAMTYVVAARNTAIRELVQQLTVTELALQIIDIEELAQRNIAALLDEDEEGVALLRLSQGSGLITISRQGELYFSRKLAVGAEAVHEQDGSFGAFDGLILDLQRALDYYERQFRQTPIRHIYIAALPEDNPAFNQAIADNVGITPKNLDLQQLMHCRNGLPEDWQCRNFLAIGAALRVEEQAA